MCIQTRLDWEAGCRRASPDRLRKDELLDLEQHLVNNVHCVTWVTAKDASPSQIDNSAAQMKKLQSLQTPWPPMRRSWARQALKSARSAQRSGYHSIPSITGLATRSVMSIRMPSWEADAHPRLVWPEAVLWGSHNRLTQHMPVTSDALSCMSMVWSRPLVVPL